MNLTDLRFTDADKAREYLEAQRWPNGPVPALRQRRPGEDQAP